MMPHTIGADFDCDVLLWILRYCLLIRLSIDISSLGLFVPSWCGWEVIGVFSFLSLENEVKSNGAPPPTWDHQQYHPRTCLNTPN